MAIDVAAHVEQVAPADAPVLNIGETGGGGDGRGGARRPMPITAATSSVRHVDRALRSAGGRIEGARGAAAALGVTTRVADHAVQE